jgi:hypothetical protein
MKLGHRTLQTPEGRYLLHADRSRSSTNQGRGDGSRVSSTRPVTKRMPKTAARAVSPSSACRSGGAIVFRTSNSRVAQQALGAHALDHTIGISEGCPRNWRC